MRWILISASATPGAHNSGYGLLATLRENGRHTHALDTWVAFGPLLPMAQLPRIHNDVFSLFSLYESNSTHKVLA